MTHQKESVRADALPPPQIESFRDLRRASTVVADDDGGDSLQQITHVAVQFGAREIPDRMRVRIDEAGTNHQPVDIQGTLTHTIGDLSSRKLNSNVSYLLQGVTTGV